MEVDVLSQMVGRTFVNVIGEKSDKAMLFIDASGRWVRFFHTQDCCESVTIEDICGDVADLVDAPLLVAERVSSDGAPRPEYADCYTWTFYRFATAKGTVTVRWLGKSNGYYSEKVSVATSEDAE